MSNVFWYFAALSLPSCHCVVYLFPHRYHPLDCFSLLFWSCLADDESALFRLRMMWCEQPRLQDKDLFKCVGRVQNLFQVAQYSPPLVRPIFSCGWSE